MVRELPGIKRILQLGFLPKTNAAKEHEYAFPG